MGCARKVTMGFGEAKDFMRGPEKRPVPIPCDYCSRASLVMQPTCDGCGAALPLSKSAVVYDASMLDRDALMNVWQPRENIPVDLSTLSHNSSLSDYVRNFLSGARDFTKSATEFKA
jgi:hypothetical protein